VKEYRTVQRVPPRKTTTAVRIIGIDAIFALRFRNSLFGRSPFLLFSMVHPPCNSVRGLDIPQPSKIFKD